MVVERGITLADRLELVVEVYHNLAQRYHEMEFHTVAAHILLLEQFATLVEAEFHDGADIVGIGDDGGAYVGFLYMLYQRLLGQTRGVVHFLGITMLVIDHIRHVGHGGDDVHIELAVEALLHYLHVEQAQEAAAETEAEGYRRLGHEGERGIVELELFQRGAQVLIVRRVDGIDTGKHHRLDFLKTGDGLIAGLVDVGNGIAHLDFLGVLDAADDIAHLAGRELMRWNNVDI